MTPSTGAIWLNYFVVGFCESRSSELMQECAISSNSSRYQKANVNESPEINVTLAIYGMFDSQQRISSAFYLPLFATLGTVALRGVDR